MLGLLLLAVGIVGFGLAAYWDVKTTEFPDWLPYSMIGSALGIRLIFAFMEGNFSIITDSVFTGLGFLALGLLFYFTNQWGDGDAWLLGALGFLFPNATGFSVAATFPFPLLILINFFFISFFYLIAYSIILGLRNPKMLRKFTKSMSKQRKRIVCPIVGFAAACLALMYVLYTYFFLDEYLTGMILFFPFLFAFLMVFVKYGRFVEENLFKKKVNVKDLREGDVPLDERWRVLSKKEITVLKKRGGTIWIKEGVRFAPVFIITLLYTILFGSLVFFI